MSDRGDRLAAKLGERVPFVLVLAPGHVTPGHEVPDADVRAAVEELGR